MADGIKVLTKDDFVQRGHWGSATPSKKEGGDLAVAPAGNEGNEPVRSVIENATSTDVQLNLKIKLLSGQPSRVDLFAGLTPNAFINHTVPDGKGGYLYTISNPIAVGSFSLHRSWTLGLLFLKGSNSRRKDKTRRISSCGDVIPVVRGKHQQPSAQQESGGSICVDLHNSVGFCPFKEVNKP